MKNHDQLVCFLLCVGAAFSSSAYRRVYVILLQKQACIQHSRGNVKHENINIPHTAHIYSLSGLQQLLFLSITAKNSVDILSE